MQDPKNPQLRKPWYQRLMKAIILWKTITSSPKLEPKPAVAVSTTVNSSRPRLRRSSSLNVASSFTRVCLCAPISSYNEVFQADVPPRRSFSYPTSKPLPAAEPPGRTASTRNSVEGRRVFRGKSLMDDILMRRFVVEEEAMMQRRRRNQMEFVKRRNAMRRKELEPSPLRRMTMAGDGEEEED